ncbi:MAG: glycosyltransferase family 2 protein [Crenarchaeota archaeon]|jgi:glycosyltransferase involved in cell wall biosynthesis|nr:glycosyltransferase family 2 protein [Thermoproteota archaeon]
MEPIDVALLTMDSERKLRACIDSIYQNVPVNRLIVVDGFSTDGTLKIIEEYQKKHGNVLVVQEEGTRGSARQTAIELVETEWFMFVDSDVVLSKDWVAQAQKFITPEVGAVWGIEIWSVLRNSPILPIFERVTLKIFEERGGTHDLLVRTKAVKGIKIPFELHTYEDGYIKKWIEKNGYKVLGVYEPYCMHYRPETIWTMEKHIGFAVSDLKYAIRRPSLMLSYGFYSGIVIAQIFLNKQEPNRKKVSRLT